MAAIPASSTITRVRSSIVSRPGGQGRCRMGQVVDQLGEGVGVGAGLFPEDAGRDRGRRQPDDGAAVGRPRPAVSADMAVVFPVPAGASASCTRRPEVAISRTRWACAALRVTPLATDSSSATSTSLGAHRARRRAAGRP